MYIIKRLRDFDTFRISDLITTYKLTLLWVTFVLFFSIYLPFHPGISRLPPICSPVRSVPGRGISNDAAPKLQPGSSSLAAGSLPLAGGNSPMTATGSPHLAATNTEKDPRQSWQTNIPPPSFLQYLRFYQLISHHSDLEYPFFIEFI